MLTVRIDKNLEQRLQAQAEFENAPKSDIVKRAINEYLNQHSLVKTPYELGVGLFGGAGSGRSDLSRNYKQLLSDSLNEKHDH